MRWQVLTVWYNGQPVPIKEYEVGPDGVYTGWCRDPGSKLERNYLTGQER